MRAAAARSADARMEGPNMVSRDLLPIAAGRASDIAGLRMWAISDSCCALWRVLYRRARGHRLQPCHRQNRKAQLTGATDLTLPEFELCAQRPKQRSRFGGYDDRAPSHRSREEHAGPADHEIAEQIEAIDAAV